MSETNHRRGRWILWAVVIIIVSTVFGTVAVLAQRHEWPLPKRSTHCGQD
jgi:hypothetical protein